MVLRNSLAAPSTVHEITANGEYFRPSYFSTARADIQTECDSRYTRAALLFALTRSAHGFHIQTPWFVRLNIYHTRHDEKFTVEQEYCSCDRSFVEQRDYLIIRINKNEEIGSISAGWSSTVGGAFTRVRSGAPGSPKFSAPRTRLALPRPRPHDQERDHRCDISSSIMEVRQSLVARSLTVPRSPKKKKPPLFTNTPDVIHRRQFSRNYNIVCPLPLYSLFI